MFDYLAKHTARQVINSVYYAIRLLTHRNSITDPSTGLRVEGLATEPSYEDVTLAQRIIEEIEQTEHMLLVDLSSSKADDYTGKLAEIAQAHAEREFSYDAERGQQLLEELRHDPVVTQGSVNRKPRRPR